MRAFVILLTVVLVPSRYLLLFRLLLLLVIRGYRFARSLTAPAPTSFKVLFIRW
jgi:hypothetical protein